ncbi:MAG: DUF354 domain-containing protein [Candidatus Caldarchaeum sp.]|nr:DUF354 domain-containing protein [Candidatus Caldarchaeum sp.]MDW8360196.1 DUF354 domain-containing protein [Candidatus Caldarchaeum sp.]
MAVVWLDILTPKQFWFFRQLAERLSSRGLGLVATSRAYEQVEPLLPGFRFARVAVIGGYGGGGLRDKLLRSVERTAKLLEFVAEFDCAVSSGSPEASRIAYGLAKPHILVSDTPHSPVNKLSAPLSSHVLTPWVIGKKPWLSYGVPPERIVLYKALDPVAWLKAFKPDRSKLDAFGLEVDGYVLVRSPEYQAAYLNRVGWRLDDYAQVLQLLQNVLNGLRLVVMPRYSEEIAFLKKALGMSAVVVERPVNDLSILFFSRLFIGGGGTMTQEAALLGVPTISFYPHSLPTVLKFLEKKGLVKHVRDMHDAVNKAGTVLRRIEDVKQACKRKASLLLNQMEDPTLKTAETVEKVISGG